MHLMRHNGGEYSCDVVDDVSAFWSRKDGWASVVIDETVHASPRGVVKRSLSRH